MTPPWLHASKFAGQNRSIYPTRRTPPCHPPVSLRACWPSCKQMPGAERARQGQLAVGIANQPSDVPTLQQVELITPDTYICYNLDLPHTRPPSLILALDVPRSIYI